jgi:TonB family protein
MPLLLNRLLLSTLILGVLWLFYHLALRPERCFSYNRIFLLLAPAVAAGVPWLPLPAPLPATATQTLVPTFLLPTVQVGAGVENASATYWLPILYAAGVAVLLARLSWQLWQQWRLTQEFPAERHLGYTLRLTGGRYPTGSFARTVYWDETAPLSSAEAAHILQHELAHVRQGHTYDRLWLALWQAALWFNPFVHLLPRALHLTHEYLADAAAGQEAPATYAALLARQATKHLGSTSSLTTAFHTSSILTRIAMLHHPPVLRRWKQWLALPLAGALLTVVACEKTAYTGTLPAPQGSAASSALTAPPPPVLSPADTTGAIYSYVEQMPVYPGGIPQLMKDISTNLHYPEAAVAADLTGSAFVSFIVEKDGSVSGVRLRKGVTAPQDQAAAAQAMNDEIVRVVRELPGHWEPGKQDGKATRVSYVVPISFAKK